MSELTVTAWEVDPAFSLLGPNSLAHPETWSQYSVEGGSPYGSMAFIASGEPVSIDPYLRDVRLIDGDGDGFIGGGDTDTFVIGDTSYKVWMVYRGDVLIVNGEKHQVVTLYGYTEDNSASTAISMPLDAEGKLIPAYAGLLSEASWSMDAEPYPIPIDSLPCFTAGTLMATPNGLVPAESLRAGDFVLTADGRAVPILWVTSRRVWPEKALRPEAQRPVCIPRGILGSGRDLRLSPLHRVLCRTRRGGEALVPVKHLVGRHGIAVTQAAEVQYIHILLPRHDLLLAEGVVCESLFAGPRMMQMLSARERREVEALLPELANAPMRPARPLLDYAAQVARHLDPALPDVRKRPIAAALSPARS